MPFTPTDLLLGFVLPAVIASALVGGLSKFSSRTVLQIAGAPFAISVGFGVGYWSLKLGPVVPDSHWQWLPYCVVLAAVFGVLSRIFRENLFLQTVLILLFATTCGFLLIPTWESFAPERSYYLVAWPLTVTAVAISAQLAFDPKEHAQQVYLGFVMCTVFVSTSILLLLADSLRFSQMALALTGASIGLLAMTVFKLHRGSIEAAIVPAVVATCGLLLVGKVNSYSSVPSISYLLLPVAFGISGVVRMPAFTHRFGRKRWLISGIVTMVICLCSIGSAAWFVFGNE